MQSRNEQKGMSSRRNGGEKRGSEASRKQDFSHCCLWQSELSIAAKQTVVWKPGRRSRAGCGMPLGGVKIYNKGEATEEKKDSFKNSAEA